MKYLTTTISSIASNPRYLLLYVFFSSMTLPISAMKQMGTIQGMVAIGLLILFGLLSLYLVTGVYAAAWGSLKGEGTNLLQGAKKHFAGALGVSIVIGILCAILLFAFLTIHKLAFFRDIPAAVYGKSLDANIIRSISVFLTTSLFVYALPGLFVANFSVSLTLAKSWRFLFKNFSKSRSVIAIVLISTLIKIVLTQWAVSYDYSSIHYWQIIALSNMLTYAFSFLTFLTAAQVLDEFFQKKAI